jgi:hypothetical protein
LEDTVPTRRKAAKGVSTEGLDFLHNVLEVWDSGWRETRRDLTEPGEVILLELEEDAAHKLHSDGLRIGRLGDDTVEVRADLVHSHTDAVGNRGVVPVEHVNHNRPTIELLHGNEDLSGETDVVGGQRRSVRESEGTTRFDQRGTLDQSLDAFHFGVAFADDGKRGQSLAKDKTGVHGRIGTEHRLE